MNTKRTYITIGGLFFIGLVAFIFYPSYSKANSGTYGVRQDISVGAYKSDTVRVSESYERILGSFIVTMENRLAVTDRGLEKMSAKLDTIENKIDGLGTILERIEEALNITEDIPRPKSPPSESNLD